MRKKINIAVLSILSLIAGTAWADSGYFAVASVGDASADLDRLFLPLVSDDDRSFDIGVGYAFNPHVAVQASWHDFGEFDGQFGCPPDCLLPVLFPFQADISGWSLRVTGAYPLGQQLAAFASLGVLVWEIDLSVTPGDAIGAFTIGTEGDDLMYEGGLRWHLSDRWSVQASYEKANLDIESAKLGVLLRF